MRLSLYCLFVSLFISINSFSQLRLPSVISPGMLIQQNDLVTFWGWGYNVQQVKITGSWDNAITTGVVNNNGKWSFPVKTPGAGGPYTITVNSGGAQIVLNDVMIGEVWLCSGQSNMEWSYYNGARYIKEEFPTCYNRNIRFFQVP